MAAATRFTSWVPVGRVWAQPVSEQCRRRGQCGHNRKSPRLGWQPQRQRRQR